MNMAEGRTLSSTTLLLRLGLGHKSRRITGCPMSVLQHAGTVPYFLAHEGQSRVTPVPLRRIPTSRGNAYVITRWQS